jgi:hypothetical protein
MGGRIMGVKRLLILPEFHYREMRWSTALLQHLQTLLPLLREASRTVLPKQRGSLTYGCRHDFDIGHHVDGVIARLISTYRLWPTHAVPPS